MRPYSPKCLEGGSSQKFALRRHILLVRLVAKKERIPSMGRVAMTVSGRLLVFGGVFATVILLVVVVGIVSGVGRNEVPDAEGPLAAREVPHRRVSASVLLRSRWQKGWIPDFEAAYVLALVEGFKPRDGAIEFLNVEDFVVFDPSEPPGEADSMPAPKDMVSWFQ
jgi:hypothetical protein